VKANQLIYVKEGVGIVRATQFAGGNKSSR